MLHVRRGLARICQGALHKYPLPKLLEKYVGVAPAVQAGKQLLDSFKDWIIASQQYRGGQKVQKQQELPLDLLVAYLSAGADFLRWMIEFCGGQAPS